MAAESKLVAQVIIDNGDAVAVSNATKDALVEAMAATERANKKIESSEEQVAKALKTRLSASKEVDGAIRAQVAAGKPLETELVQLSILYQRLEAAMRAAAKSGGGMPAGLAEEAARVRARMGVVESQISAANRVPPVVSGTSISQLASYQMALTGVGLGLHSVGMAARSAAEFLSDCVEQAAEAEAVSVRLSKALESQGRFTVGARDKILEYSNALSRDTAFSDDAITAIQTRLIMTGKLSDEVLPATTRATLDLVAAGESEEGATDALSKAYAGNFKALGNMLPAIRDAVKEAKSFEEVLELVNEQVGGQAAAQLDTYEGKVKALSNSWGEFKETVGNEMLPVLSDLVDGLRMASNAGVDLMGLAKDASASDSPWQKLLDVTPYLGPLRALIKLREDLAKDPNVAMLEEHEEAWKGAQATLEKMQAGRNAGTVSGALALAEQEQAVDNLYAAYVRLFMKQEEKGLGDFKGGNIVPTIDEEKGDDKGEAKEAAERKRDIAEALGRVKRKQDEATTAAKEYVDALIEQKTAEDEHALAIVQLEHRNEALREQMIAMVRTGDEYVEVQLEEIKNNEILIRQHEDDAKSRDKAATAAENQAKRIADKEIAESERAAEARRVVYQQLGESITATMATAFVEMAAGEKSGGQIARQVARQTALAVINAAASEAAAKQIAAHAGIPIVGVQIGLAAAAAIVTAIFAQKRFLAMAGGGELRGGIPGADSIPIMGMPGENMVDQRTNTRLKKMLDAFESGGVQTSALGGGSRGNLTIQIMQGPSVVPDSDAAFDRKTESMIRSVQRAFDMGELRIPSSAVQD